MHALRELRLADLSICLGTVPKERGLSLGIIERPAVIARSTEHSSACSSFSGRRQAAASWFRALIGNHQRTSIQVLYVGVVAIDG